MKSSADLSNPLSSKYKNQSHRTKDQVSHSICETTLGFTVTEEIVNRGVENLR